MARRDRLDAASALESVKKLFSEADAAFPESTELSDRYVAMARKAAQRARVSIPQLFKKRFCRHCGCYWMPGKTVRVRLQKQKVVYYCLKCRHYTRHPYVAEKKAKREELFKQSKKIKPRYGFTAEQMDKVVEKAILRR